MATQAQVLANQANATLSTGPATAAGKARVSQNATKLGLFSTTSFVTPEEQAIFAAFHAEWLHQLAPVDAIQDHVAREIVQAAWRMRRCTNLEMEIPAASDDPEERERAERMQSSIDRARATAHRVFHRCISELGRMQTEYLRRTALPFSKEAIRGFGVANCEQVEAFQSKIAERLSNAALRQIITQPPPSFDRTRESPVPTTPRVSKGEQPEITKQSQSQPATNSAKQSQSIPRGAPCPCKSGEKYKRCCGRNAPPLPGASAKAAA
jgi:hypothetical protein